MQKPLIPVFLTLFLGLLLAGPVMAADTDQAAQRIKQRLSQVDTMKEAGEVGETADGYLAQRQPLAGRKAAIVRDENADREIIYRSVADRTGQTVAEVGQQRALQIAQRARSGVWLQNPSGEWYRKP
jgi:uncharacterized protein YdbL (DUF1318 family)